MRRFDEKMCCAAKGNRGDYSRWRTNEMCHFCQSTCDRLYWAQSVRLRTGSIGTLSIIVIMFVKCVECDGRWVMVGDWRRQRNKSLDFAFVCQLRCRSWHSICNDWCRWSLKCVFALFIVPCGLRSADAQTSTETRTHAPLNNSSKSIQTFRARKQMNSHSVKVQS